jgi:Tol biopolymer transport system component
MVRAPSVSSQTGGQDVEPAWSPDGALLAFSSDVDGDFDLYIVDADGSNLSRLTNLSGDEHVPSWSPDGHTIGFGTSGGESGPFSIRLVGVDGTGMKTLITTGQRWEWVSGPIWSPDGSTLAFGATEGGYGGAYAMDPDGSNIRLLTDGEGDDSVTEWSPDGTRIAMVADRDGGCIFLMDADGSHVTQLTKGCAEASTSRGLPTGRGSPGAAGLTARPTRTSWARTARVSP